MAASLLSIVELGGYPDFAPLYRRLGYEPAAISSGRRALGELKKRAPAVVVTEFNFQREFRDRTSALETVLAAVQNQTPVPRVVAFYDPEELEPLERLRKRFAFLEVLPRPVDEAALERLLAGDAD